MLQILVCIYTIDCKGVCNNVWAGGRGEGGLIRHEQQETTPTLAVMDHVIVGRGEIYTIFYLK